MPANPQPDTSDDARPDVLFYRFRGPAADRIWPATDVALAVKHAGTRTTAPIAIYSDETGRPIDLDLRGSDDEIATRLRQTLPMETTEAKRGLQTAANSAAAAGRNSAWSRAR